MSINKFGANRELDDLLKIIRGVKALKTTSDWRAEFAREIDS